MQVVPAVAAVLPGPEHHLARARRVAGGEVQRLCGAHTVVVEPSALNEHGNRFPRAAFCPVAAQPETVFTGVGQHFTDKGNIFAQSLLANVLQRADIQNFIPISPVHALGREAALCHGEIPGKAAAGKAAAVQRTICKSSTCRYDTDHRLQMRVAQSRRAPLCISEV